MTSQEMAQRIWCEVFAQSFVRLTRADGLYQGYDPAEARIEAVRLADASVGGRLKFDSDFGRFF